MGANKARADRANTPAVEVSAVMVKPLRGAELARARFEESARVKRELAAGSAEVVARAAELVYECLRSGHKVLLCGNGGSAADAQHIAGEFVGRYLKERRALPAIALTTDTSILTAIGNDYSFDIVFARQVEAIGAPGDVLIGISTSGNSPDVLRAVEAAQRIGLRTIGLTGQSGGQLAGLADICVRVPSSETPRVQEGHIAIAHVLCELVEDAIVEDAIVENATDGDATVGGEGR
jgi:D-sedoheptulose 7-phosphate isomerase